MIRTIHRAKYVLAEADLLLQNAAVHVSDPGRISRVEPWTSPPPTLEAHVVDWGPAIILPGLVNAHCHLEFTDLHKRITEFSSFTDWLGQLIRLRSGWTDYQYRESVLKGLELSLRAGTTLVGDVSTSGESWKTLRGTRLRKVVFEEVLGLSARGAAEAVAGLKERFRDDTEDRLSVHGVSPHAPYSVSSDLYRAVSELARDRALPFATHAAETAAESEFLQVGTGELHSFLSGMGKLPEGWQPPARTPISYLEAVDALATAPLLIHCNYLDEPAVAKILHNRSSVVYCPRSHDFFGHPDHPVRQLLDAGVNVALGTDSLASNESLSVLDEMRFLFGRRKDIKAEEIIRMATLNGAAALQFGGVTGRLRRGYWADMTVLALPPEVGCRNLVRQILQGAGGCIGTIVGGEIAWRDEA